jgi:peptide deformylase
LTGAPVDSFGKWLHGLLDEMTEVMREAPGVGLAAQQIGEALQVCVIEVEGRLHELVNPRIVSASGDQTDLEGCLSLAGYYAPVTRREHVAAVAQNRHGRNVRLSGTGLLARAIQHELDHLNGKLYVDLLDSLDELIPPGGRDEADKAAPANATQASATQASATQPRAAQRKAAADKAAEPRSAARS